MRIYSDHVMKRLTSSKECSKKAPNMARTFCTVLVLISSLIIPCKGKVKEV